LNEDQRKVSKFEQINHYYVLCKNDLDKYLFLFALKKLSLIEGKLIIYANTIIQAYRIKFFLNRFQIKAFVISPEMAKQQITSIIHFFQIG
jgi:ATP-dependent RNA helicase DDX56/DBP9